MEEFLESCRATSLLAELEDDDELPEAEDDENEDEDVDEEEDYEDNYDEELLETRNTLGKRKAWDDEHVIKRKFSALIPAFDPRPGRYGGDFVCSQKVGPGFCSTSKAYFW